MDGTIAVVTCFAGNFAPRNWAFCEGQILSIAQNTALFALLGTTYGGNGQTTFALPNLKGRVPISPGQGPGLSNYDLGEVGGNTTVTLTTANLPAHVHVGNSSISLRCNTNFGDESAPDGFYPAASPQSYATTATPGVNMLAPTYTATIFPAGGSQPLPLMPPYLAINYVICMFGVFPSRN